MRLAGSQGEVAVRPVDRDSARRRVHGDRCGTDAIGRDGRYLLCTGQYYGHRNGLGGESRGEGCSECGAAEERGEVMHDDLVQSEKERTACECSPALRTVDPRGR